MWVSHKLALVGGKGWFLKLEVILCHRFSTFILLMEVKMAEE